MNKNDMQVLPEDPTLRGKLEEIARLEREHGIIGVSILPKEGQGTILTRDMADHVISVIKEAVEVTSDPSKIPTLDDLRSDPDFQQKLCDSV